MSKIVVALVYPVTHNHTVAYVQRMARVVSWGYNTLVGVVAVIVLMVALQMVYPQNRTRPFLKISGMSYGFVSGNQLGMKLQALDDQTQTLVLAQKTYQTTANRIGVNVDAEQISKEATQYSWKQRLVPFSLLSHGENLTPNRTTDQKKLDVYVDQLVAENSQLATSAKLVETTSGKYEIEPAKQGVIYEKPQLKQALARLPVSASSTTEMGGRVVIPPITEAELENVIEEITNLEALNITIALGDQKITLSGAQLKTWASIRTDEGAGIAEVTYAKSAIEEWLRTKSPLVTQAETPALVYILDGAEQRKQLGAEGKALDTSTTALAIIDAAKKGKEEVTATVVAVSPSQHIIRSYSSTNAGLSALIKDWQAERSSAQTAVYFEEIGGKNRTASANAGASYFAASLYKLYTAYYLLSGIQNQSINASEPVVNGKDIAGCVQAMIVVSDNLCPEALGNRFGWNTINAFIAGNGFGASSVANGNNTVTASSVGEYLKRLNSGGLLNAQHTATLLGYMGQQKYRSAIPAGVQGVTVQNKVGFYGSTWHDAAVVHSQKGTYILVVLTKGSSPAAIADLTRRIDAIL